MSCLCDSPQILPCHVGSLSRCLQRDQPANLFHNRVRQALRSDPGLRRPIAPRAILASYSRELIQQIHSEKTPFAIFQCWQTESNVVGGLDVKPV